MWVLKLIIGMFNEVMLATLENLGDYMNNIFDVMYQLYQKLNLDRAQEYIVFACTSLVAVLFIINATSTYVLRIEGDHEEDPLDVMVRLCRCIVYILCGSWGIEYLIALTSTFTSELLDLITSEKKGLTGTMVDIIVSSSKMGTGVLILQAIVMVIVFVMYLIFIYKAAKRGAELLGYELFLPFVALDMLKANDERWRAFSSKLFVCITGYAIQLVFFNLFLKLFIDGTSGAGLISNPWNLFGSFAMLQFAISGPKWMQEFMYKTGLGEKITGGARGAMFLLPQLLRR